MIYSPLNEVSHLFARHWTHCNTGYGILNSQSTDGGLVNVPFDDWIEVALDSLLDVSTASHSCPLKSSMPWFLVDCESEAMAYTPAAVAASGKLLYTLMFPTAPIDHFLEDGNDMVSIDCELARCRWGAVGIAAKVIKPWLKRAMADEPATIAASGELHYSVIPSDCACRPLLREIYTRQQYGFH